MSEHPRRRRGRLVSIGYQGRSVDELVQVLAAEDVDLLIDVRENAQSRKPGFSRSRLTAVLAERGIEYVHEPCLGNPRTNREAFRAGDRSARRRFATRLRRGSRRAVEEIVSQARHRVVALLCFERAHEECHRSVITDMAAAEEPRLTVIAV